LIDSGDRLVAVSDSGYFFEARLIFDETAQLSGLGDARVTSLVSERSQPVTGLGRTLKVSTYCPLAIDS